MQERTVGIEEEFLLVQRAGTGLVADGEAVVSQAQRVSGAPDADERFEHELKLEQVELGTRPHSSLAQLSDDLRVLRTQLATGASARGARLVAMASNPFGQSVTTTPDERYQRMDEQFGLVSWRQLTCGMHVHVGVSSRAEGVAVLDRLRPWLPVLVALSANSAIVDGTDTGYASYRSLQWGQWPTSGPAEGFGDEAGYDAACADLIASGAALDDGMIYFAARLSAKYPTVEIRAADVCARYEDAVLVAALARGLVAAAAADWADGASAPVVRSELLRAATWRAARWGIEGQLFDLVARRLVPAWELVDSMLDWIGDRLPAADGEAVKAGLAVIRERGTGSVLQREAWSGGGSSAGARTDRVVEALGAVTVP